MPVWIAVPRRLPSAPKMLPRRPIAARDEYEKAGKPFEGAGNGAERDAGDEVTELKKPRARTRP